LRTFRRNILAAFVDVGLYHDSCDMLLACPELLAYAIEHKRLIPVILLRVSIFNVQVH
jgi:hypothetical protein